MLRSYLEHMVAVRDLAARMANNFGIPDIKEVRVVYPSGDRLLLSPNPFVVEEYPEAETIKNLDIDGLAIRFEVRGVSRRYKESQLKGEGIQYLIGEKFCNLTRLTARMTTFDLELIHYQGESEITPFYV